MENTFENLLDTVNQEHKDFASQIHNNFLNAGFKAKIENKAAGFFASYKNPKTKKSAFNFFFRKKGLHVRLYPSCNSGLVTLTDKMVAEIEKAPDCKRLAQTGDCSLSCSMGYEFDLRGKHYIPAGYNVNRLGNEQACLLAALDSTHYQKCRYKAFEFFVTEDSKPVITKWVDAEIIQ